MGNRQIYWDLLAMVRHVLDGTPQPAHTDWDEVTVQANRGMLIGFVYRAVSERREINPAVKQRIENAYFSATGEQVRQAHYAATLFGELKKRGIPYMPMRGYCLRPLYPQPTCRISCDLELYCEREHGEEVAGILDGFGFRCVKTKPNSVQYALDCVTIEVHYALGATPEDEAYWANLTDRLQTDDGIEYRMTDEDFYLYLLTRMKEGILDGAVGIRAILDQYIFRLAKTGLDTARLTVEEQKLGVGQLARATERLGDVWFGGAEGTNDEILLGSFIAAGGAYGATGVIASEQTPDGGTELSPRAKFHYTMRRIFPPFRTMRREFGILTYLPFLLPVMWVVRGFACLVAPGAMKRKRETPQPYSTLGARSAKMIQRVREILAMPEEKVPADKTTDPEGAKRQ